MAEGLDDEEALMKSMRGGVWHQAPAIVTAGEF